MSKYTTELRFICEAMAGLEESKGYDDVASIIQAAAPRIFNFEYPIFDSAYKPELQIKILRHFYNREIAYETYGLWKLKLEDKMNIIMPYYNKLYQSELLSFNPFIDTDYTKTGSREDEGEREDSTTISDTQNATSNRTNYNAYADTPQMTLSEIPSNAGNATLTSFTKDIDNDTNSFTNSGTRATESSNSSSGSYTERIVGKTNNRNYMEIVKSLTENFISIDNLIFKQLETLFMQIW